MKKGEITNGTLALLVVAALVVTVAGTYIVSTKMNKISGFGGVTGFATNTSTGYVNLTIEQQLSFNLTDALIEFGSGYVTSGSSGTIDSFDGTEVRADFDGPGAEAGGDHISLWNDGNVLENISVKSDKAAVAFFCTGNTSACDALGLAKLQYKTVPDTATCTGHPTTYTDLLTTDTVFCNNLAPNGLDTEKVNLTAFVEIPTDAVTGNHLATLTFTASVA